MKSKRVVTLKSKNKEALKKELTKLKKYQFEYLEVRLDYIDNIDEYIALLNDYNLIITNRYEGNDIYYNEEEYINIYLDLINKFNNIKMIDLELLKLNNNFNYLIQIIKSKKIAIIGSYHDFNTFNFDDNKYSQLLAIYHKYQLSYLKLALHIDDKKQLNNLKKYKNSNNILIGMSIYGYDTRINPDTYQSYLNYSSIDGDDTLGQISIKKLQ